MRGPIETEQRSRSSHIRRPTFAAAVAAILAAGPVVGHAEPAAAGSLVCQLGASEDITFPPPDRVAHSRFASLECDGDITSERRIQSTLYKRNPDVNGGDWIQAGVQVFDEAFPGIAEGQQLLVSDTWLCTGNECFQGDWTYKHVSNVAVYASEPIAWFQTPGGGWNCDNSADLICSRVEYYSVTQ